MEIVRDNVLLYLQFASGNCYKSGSIHGRSHLSSIPWPCDLEVKRHAVNPALACPPTGNSVLRGRGPRVWYKPRHPLTIRTTHFLVDPFLVNGTYGKNTCKKWYILTTKHRMCLVPGLCRTNSKFLARPFGICWIPCSAWSPFYKRDYL